MLSILAAAAVAAQPIPADFDLASLETPVVIEQPVYQTSETTYSNDPREATEWQAYNRGVEQRRIAFHVLNAGDLATTAYCLEVAENCEEANPIYGQHIERVVVGKVAQAVFYELMLDHLRDSGNRDAVRLFQWINITILGGVVVWNSTVIF